MHPIFDLVGPNRAVQLFGVKLVGVNAENGKKFLFTVGFIVLILAMGRLLRTIVGWSLRGRSPTTRFWVRQAVHLLTAAVLLIGVLSIWFDDPNRLAAALGLATAGLAFALQRVITALAGYFVILRGSVFNVGDRIVMGGVRGDVIALGFIQTTIMEMGQPPPVQNADPAMWVMARQYTGRIVTITNDKIFDTPVYNYTRDFPYIWEELRIGVPFKADRERAEQILLEAARHHTADVATLGEATLSELERRYMVKRTELQPRLFWRLTDNWLEMSVRFITREHGVRELKDAISREVLAGFDRAGIEVASGTYEIVGMPPLRVQMVTASPERPDGR